MRDAVLRAGSAWSGVFIALLLAVLPLIAMAQEVYYDKIATEIILYEDGSQTVREYQWDDHKEQYVPRNSQVSPAVQKHSFQPAVIERCLRWKAQNKAVFFNFTPDALKYRPKINTVFNKYTTQRRGVTTSPRPITRANKVAVKPLNQFNNIIEYRHQFDDDDNNTIVMTNDDNFFKGPTGELLDKKQVGRTWVYSIARVTLNNNKWRGTYYIEETDIFLRSDFFARKLFTFQSSLAGLVRFSFGYKKPVWVYDLNSENAVFTFNMFKNVNKPMWKQIIKGWDELYYASKLVEPSAQQASVLPGDGFVFDLADYQVPDTSINNPDPTARSDVLFVTNLLGFNGNKKLVCTFFAVYKDPNNPNKTIRRKIFDLGGNAYDYPKSISNIGTWYPTIWLNTVKIGHKSRLNTLKNQVKKFGSAKKIEGAKYEKALKIEVIIKGYLSESTNKKTSKKVITYFVNSDAE